MVQRIRAEGKPGLIESFLAEYGLSSAEGIALMRLAEALLRVPDAATIDALVTDKIAPGNWASHCGHAAATRAIDRADSGGNGGTLLLCNVKIRRHFLQMVWIN